MTTTSKRHRLHNRFLRSLSRIATVSAVAFTALVLISPPAQAGFKAEWKVCFDDSMSSSKRIAACNTLLRDYNIKRVYKALLERAKIHIGLDSEQGDKKVIEDLSSAIASSAFNAMDEHDIEFATFWRGIARFKLGQFELAADDFTIGKNNFSSQTYIRRAAYRLALSLEKQGKYDSAEQAYKDTLKIASRVEFKKLILKGTGYDGYADDIPEAYIKFRLGVVSVQLKKYNKAIELLTASTTNFYISKRAELYNERGLAYRRLNKLNQASADYTRAMEFGTKLEKSLSYVRRGYVKYLQDDYQGSLSDNNAATRLNPRNATAYMDLGDTYVKLGQRDKAVATYRQALKISPNLKGAKEGLARLAKTAPAATPKPAPKIKVAPVVVQATVAAPSTTPKQTPKPEASPQVQTPVTVRIPDRSALPPEVQADLLAIDLENAMKAGDRVMSAALLAALKPLADKTGQKFWFTQGKALAEQKWYAEAKLALNNYLTVTGREGEDYKQALQLFAEVSKQATTEAGIAEARKAETEKVEARKAKVRIAEARIAETRKADARIAGAKMAEAKRLLNKGNADGALDAEKLLKSYIAQIRPDSPRYQEVVKLYEKISKEAQKRFNEGFAAFGG